MPQKKILIVAPVAYGYSSYIFKSVSKFSAVDCAMIYTNHANFQYKNTLHRVQNFIYKTFLNRNLKKEYGDKLVVKQLKEIGFSDVIFIIRPDYLNRKTLKILRKSTDNFITLFYDSTRRFKKKLKLLPLFDKIYSYDKLDVEKYNFEFLTNYIFDESVSKEYKFLFFNISTYDYRFSLIEKLAKYIAHNNWSKSIFQYNTPNLKSDYLNIISDPIPVYRVIETIKACKIMIDIQRDDQIGLSFRVFEALGYRKKLITTNIDIVNYDFYNPQNILVLDPNNIEIPKSFVESPYEDVPDHILAPYRIDNWVKKVFDLE